MAVKQQSFWPAGQEAVQEEARIIQMGGAYGEIRTKKDMYQRKRRLCRVVLYGFLPPQTSRPELHGQAVYPRAALYA